MVVLPILLSFAATVCEFQLQQVVSALQQKDLVRGVSLLESARSQCSESSSYYALLGSMDELSGKAEEAEIAYRKAISLDPQSARLKAQLGATYLRNKKPAEAVALLREAMTLDPSNALMKKYLIGAYVETKSWSKAASLFDELGEKLSSASDPILVVWFATTMIETGQARRLDRDLPPGNKAMSPQLLFSLGTLFAQHSLYAKAIDYLREIPKEYADDAVYFNLGLACSHLQRYDEARRNYFAAIDRHPEHAEAYFRVGLDYAASGDPRKALPWLFRAQQFAPSRADVVYALSEQLMLLEYFDTAQEILTRARGEYPSNLLLAVAAADLKEAKGDAESASEEYRRILVEQPEYSPALIGLARADIAKGQNAEARSSLTSVLSRDADDALANGELGMLEARENSWAAASTHLDRSWARDKSNVTIALALSRAKRGLNRPADALSVLRAVPSSMQQSSEYHLELSQTYNQLHNVTQAKTEREIAARWRANAQEGLHFDPPKSYFHVDYVH